MKRQPIELDLKQLIKSGKFSPFSSGMSKEEILNLGITPDYWVNDTTKEESEIWWLGNFELFFDSKNNLLKSIFNDHVPQLISGNQLVITNWWILPNKEKDRLKKSKIKINKVIRELHRMRIDYEKFSYHQDT